MLNKKMNEFLNSENTVEVKNEMEFNDFVNLLKRDGAYNRVFGHHPHGNDYSYWEQIVKCSSKGSNNMIFEYDRAYKDVALYTEREDSENWYGKAPYTVPELERAGV